MSVGADIAVERKIPVCKRQCGDVSASVGSGSSEPAVTVPMRTVALVRGIDLVLEHHEVPVDIRACFDQQIHAYLDSSVSESVWLKKCKFLLTYPLAKYLRNELPPKPDDGSFEPSGSLRQWMKARMSFNRRNTHLWYSWFQAKRATLPLSDDLIEETYQKHFATLSKEDKGVNEIIDQIFADKTFSRTLSRVTDGITAILSRSSPFEELGASSSACFEQTRGSGGQLYELRARTGIVSQLLWGTQLERMEWRPYVHGRVRETNVTMEVRGHDGRHLWQTLEGISKSVDRNDFLSCTIQAVLEPNKVRVISKGEAVPYYNMRPLQKAMHSAMREMPCFRLIGRPFSATDIIDLTTGFEREAQPRQNWKWFSIDYSAATDGLSWKYSSEIFRRILSSLPFELKDRAMQVLGPHKLYYPTRDGKREFKGVQKNGQLMGSVLSFPVLCLANLGVYLLNTQELQQGWTDEQRLNHVLVNGDDMVYAAPDSLWKEHVDLGKRVGLEMSVGKAYKHSTYLNINSVSVHCPLNNDKERHRPWRIDYLNVGLAFGQHKVQERSNSRLEAASCDDRKPEGYVCNINTVLDGCLPGRQERMLDWILRNKREVIAEECRVFKDIPGIVRNLFLPVQIGGMGVLKPKMETNRRLFPKTGNGLMFAVKKADSMRALAALYSHSAKASLDYVLPGYELLTVDLDVNEPWIKRCSDLAEGESSYIRRLQRDLSSASRSNTYLKSDRHLVRSIATVIRYADVPRAWTR